MTKKHLILLVVMLCFPLLMSAQTDTTDDENTNDENTTEQNDSLVVSHIEIYNAFSPNGDNRNDVLRVKSSTGIVEFKAIIFNRWGQKLYEWTDINGGWDGNVNGKPAKQGTYFVLVKAKGSDGQTHTIKRDVNLLRGYNEGYSNEQ